MGKADFSVRTEWEGGADEGDKGEGGGGRIVRREGTKPWKYESV